MSSFKLKPASGSFLHFILPNTLSVRPDSLTPSKLFPGKIINGILIIWIRALSPGHKIDYMFSATIWVCMHLWQCNSECLSVVKSDAENVTTLSRVVGSL
jgi:hypothetical protein